MSVLHEENCAMNLVDVRTVKTIRWPKDSLESLKDWKNRKGTNKEHPDFCKAALVENQNVLTNFAVVIKMASIVQSLVSA